MYVQAKKLENQLLRAATVGECNVVNRLYVKDLNSDRQFLIDSGADISVLPKSLCSASENTEMILYAANGSEIKTYGKSRITLNLGLRRPFSWTFVVADVKNAIIGADFLKFYDLLIDLKRNILRDRRTQLSTSCSISKIQADSVKAFNVNNELK